MRDALRLRLGLLLLALICLAATLVGTPFVLLLRRERRMLYARRIIQDVFSSHLWLMRRLGTVRVEAPELAGLEQGPACVVCPNHPSMIDAALLLAHTTRLTCIMKSSILANPLFGVGARLAGYIPNEPPRTMMRAADEALRMGRHLLLFPEGTRTVRLPVGEFQRTVATIARRAGVPVQTVIIETASPFLCKGWPLFRTPAMPMVYRVRLGRRFDPPADVEDFTAQLEAYFRDELARAVLPSLPVRPDDR